MAAATPYKLDDTVELQRLGKTLLRSRNIVLVVFCDPAHKPLAVTCRDSDFTIEKWQASYQVRPSTLELMRVQERQMPSLGKFLQVTVPVLDMAAQNPHLPSGQVSKSRMLGYLTVGISQTNEYAELERATLLSVLAGSVVFLLSLPLVSGMVHRIFQPIRQLVLATNRIASGDYSAAVAADRPDEIGMLARSFNAMARCIQQSQQDLRIANENLAEANRDLEQKVRQRTAELEASNSRLSSEISEKEEFLRAVSHDLNAPLRNIGGMAAVLLMKYRGKFDEEVIHRLERIRKNVEVETDLITELLELSRIKTRRQKMEVVDIGAMIDDLRDMFEDDLKGREISLVIDSTLPKLHGERLRLRQLFQNLVDNAIKYMGDSAAREIHVGCQPTPESVEFYVRDTGIGIDPEDLGKVFGVFRRGKNTAELNVAGKGVGLSSVKSIVQNYGGKIWVESELGKGSVFRFTVGRNFVPALMKTSTEQLVA